MIRRILTLALVGCCWRDAAASEPVSVAMLTYGRETTTGRCFSDSFLSLVARETSIRLDRHMTTIALDSDELARHPFAVMTGEGPFDLTAAETRRLRRFLLGGGFLLASAGCSSDAWAASMQRAVELALPEASLIELPMDHPVFHSLFDVGGFMSRKREPVKILAIELEGRVVMLYSPQGLNDTNEVNPLLAAEGQSSEKSPPSGDPAACCCCNGDEITSAKYINANALVYAIVE